MYSPDAIEAINFDQLATTTDRLLLRGGFPNRASANRISRPLTSGPRPASVPPRNRWHRFTTTALITALLSVTVAIATLS